MHARAVVVAAVVAGAIALVACKKTAATPSGPRTCTSDEECVFSCEPKGDCCHNPYCESAMHRDDAEEARAYNAEHCTPDDHAKCPVIGARGPRDYKAAPRCRSGACVTEKTPLADGAAPLPD
jgi:hypothetical protein